MDRERERQSLEVVGDITTDTLVPATHLLHQTENMATLLSVLLHIYTLAVSTFLQYISQSVVVRFDLKVK